MEFDSCCATKPSELQPFAKKSCAQPAWAEASKSSLASARRWTHCLDRICMMADSCESDALELSDNCTNLTRCMRQNLSPRVQRNIQNQNRTRTPMKTNVNDDYFSANPLPWYSQINVLKRLAMLDRMSKTSPQFIAAFQTEIRLGKVVV